MHRALTIPELFCLIVNEAGGDRRLSVDTRTLVALVLTCRTFHEPALDVLWEKQYRLVRLIQCLPDDLWMVSTSSHPPRKTLMLREPTRPTTELDWVRFDFYAKRIRQLHYGVRSIYPPENDFGTVSESERLFCWLFTSRPSRNPLPSLTTLRWIVRETFDSHACAHMLFGPRLSRIYIDAAYEAMPTASQIIVPTLHHLPRCSPEVQKLELQVLWEPSTESIGVEILMSLERLKVLKFMLTMSMVPDVLPRLATLSSLTELWLSVQYMDTGDQDDEDITMPDVTFPALTKLSLQTDYMSQSNVFLRICCFPRLQELYIRVEKVESTELDSEDLATMVRLISQCCAHTVLEKINVQIDGDSSEQLFSAVSLRPLNVFRRLRILEIGADLHFLLDDNTVRDMATSWPCLEYLELWVLAPPQSLTPTTLEGLMHLAKHCPSLQTLAINVDTSRPITTPLSELDGSHCNHVLDDLSTVHSPVLGDPSEIGAVLNAIFPNLTCVNEDEIDEIRDSWRPVEEAMRKLRDGCQSEDTA